MLLKNYVGTRVGIDSPESKRSNYIQKDRISDTSPPVVSNANHQLGAVLQPLREPIDFFRDAKQQGKVFKTTSKCFSKRKYVESFADIIKRRDGGALENKPYVWMVL